MLRLQPFTFTFRPDKRGLRKFLGDLEAEAMEAIWEMGEVTVRDLASYLGDLADYNTLKSVLNRLSERGLLKRIPNEKGGGLLYQCPLSREHFLQAAERAITEDESAEAGPVVSHYIEHNRSSSEPDTPKR